MLLFAFEKQQQKDMAKKNEMFLVEWIIFMQYLDHSPEMYPLATRWEDDRLALRKDPIDDGWPHRVPRSSTHVC